MTDHERRLVVAFLEMMKKPKESETQIGRVKVPCPKCRGTGQIELELEKETTHGS